MTTTLKFTLGFLLLVQVFVGASFELAHDEAYYWLFSRNLDFGYFDHPPGVAAVIAAFSFLPRHELSVRLGFILLQFATLFLLFGLIPRVYWMRTTLLFFAFPLASFSGLLALPDMPLLFMTAAYFYVLRGFLQGRREAVFLMGPVIALLLYAKYHGILLVIFTILALPRLLREKAFWGTAIVALGLFLPHLWWQYAHDFMTLRYHFLERPSSSFSFPRIFDYLGTQLVLSGVLVGPLVWWGAARKTSGDFPRVLRFVAWGILLFFLVSTFSKRVEANWTISLVIPLVILSVTDDIWKKRWAHGLLVLSFGIVVAARSLFLFPNLPVKRVGEFHGWSDWTKKVQAKCQGLPIMANSYQIASKLSFYSGVDVSALNYHSRKNQFDLWASYPEGPVCYVTDKSEFSGPELLPPEGKPQKVVLTFSSEALREKKSESLNRKGDNP